jgi:amino-acid N-acetyltransferase
MIRPATLDDSEAIHELVSSHLDEGHLLPRDLSELRVHATRFVVCDVAGRISACAELAPLSPKVAEVRSLVVSRDFRNVGLAQRLVDQLRATARMSGFDTLTAFTHDARFFVRQGFSIVPHVWVPEKILTDCVGCPLFRKCEQFAVVLPLQTQQMYRSTRPQATARVA